MEKEIIKDIDIKDFELIKPNLIYSDENVIVSDNLKLGKFQKFDSIRIKFFLIAICIEGEICIYINGKPHIIKKNDVFFILPTMILNRIEMKDNHVIRFLGFSSNFLQNTIKRGKNTDKLFYNIYKNPIRNISKETHSNISLFYSTLIEKTILDKDNEYQKEILQYLFSAVFCNMLNILKKQINENEEFIDKDIKRSNYVFKKFINELSKNGGMNRSVQYYADRMCYSPKYISSVVKQISGRTAMEWINEYAIAQIKMQLKYSDKSIKEIADYFNFSNQSFFGKYVKKQLGISPAKYREKAENFS